MLVVSPYKHPPSILRGEIGPHANQSIFSIMIFQESSLTPVDYSNLKPGSVANATMKSFNYRSGFCFATVVADNKSVSAIIGKATDYPIKDVLPLKGLEVEIVFVGTKVVDGITYPRYALSF